MLRALHARYSPVAYEAIIAPILAEIGRRKPVRPRRRPDGDDPEADPLRASAWPRAREGALGGRLPRARTGGGRFVQDDGDAVGGEMAL